MCNLEALILEKKHFFDTQSIGTLQETFGKPKGEARIHTVDQFKFFVRPGEAWQIWRGGWIQRGSTWERKPQEWACQQWQNVEQTQDTPSFFHVWPRVMVLQPQLHFASHRTKCIAQSHSAWQEDGKATLGSVDTSRIDAMEARARSLASVAVEATSQVGATRFKAILINEPKNLCPIFFDIQHYPTYSHKEFDM